MALEFLANPLIQLGMGIIGTMFQSSAESEAEEVNEERFKELVQFYQGARNELWSMYQSGTEEEQQFAQYVFDFVSAEGDEQRRSLTEAYDTHLRTTMEGLGEWTGAVAYGYEGRTGDVMGRLAGVTGDVVGYHRQRITDVIAPLKSQLEEVEAGYQEQYELGMKDLEGAGEQSRRDIEERFDDMLGEARAQLARRGASSSTLWPSIKGRIEEERTAELNRLDESLTEQRMQWREALSGNLLAAKERGAQITAAEQTALSGDLAGAMERLGTLGVSTLGQLSGEQLSALQNMGMFGTGLQANMGMQAIGNLSNLDLALLGMDLDMLQGYQNILANRPNQLLGMFWNPAMAQAGFMEGRTDAYPDQSWASNQNLMVGQNIGYEAPQAQYDWLSSGIGVGGALGIGLLTGGLGGFGFGVPHIPCDRNLKEDFAPIDEQAILDALEQLPIEMWRYKGYDRVHIGPTAQDFWAFFHFGDPACRAIDMIDAIGVCLAAIKAMSRRLTEYEEEHRIWGSRLSLDERKLLERLTEFDSHDFELLRRIDQLHEESHSPVELMRCQSQSSTG